MFIILIPIENKTFEMIMLWFYARICTKIGIKSYVCDIISGTFSLRILFWKKFIKENNMLLQFISSSFDFHKMTNNVPALKWWIEFEYAYI